MSAARYAIYYAPPPESPLWTFGSAVLGYDAATAEPRPPLAPEGISTADWTAITAQPRRYGFHGTLKAPFRLAEGASEDDLVRAGHVFARKLRGFELPPLEIGPVATFAALKPLGRSEPLEAMAAKCVEAFEPFRAAPTPTEVARRLEAPLTERQMTYLERWGYPYVFEDFRFHMTLTGSLPEDRLATVVSGLAELYERHVGAAATHVGAVTLYVEEDPLLGFHIVDRFVFGA
ncbi:DUF1045 domain-containing protein [Methylopila sp. M107]|uniref:DUF1045 domain-containing protein n=1 Tax=Methylopila sp. M107 TaxID=1101190 RepID=UPI000370834A|nr:DUF1045 domain-containing protein [Methylopila sp. M107]